LRGISPELQRRLTGISSVRAASILYLLGLLGRKWTMLITLHVVKSSVYV
jgi:hypothetical protein